MVAIENNQLSATCIVGERLHIDTVGPTEPALNGETRVVVMRDDYSEHASAAGLTDAESASTWRAVRNTNDIEGGEITGIRSDRGSEFQGAFDEGCKKYDIKREYGLPLRS